MAFERHLKGWKVSDCQTGGPGSVHLMKPSYSSYSQAPVSSQQGCWLQLRAERPCVENMGP